MLCCCFLLFLFYTNLSIFLFLSFSVSLFSVSVSVYELFVALSTFYSSQLISSFLVLYDWLLSLYWRSLRVNDDRQIWFCCLCCAVFDCRRCHDWLKRDISLDGDTSIPRIIFSVVLLLNKILYICPDSWRTYEATVKSVLWTFFNSYFCSKAIDEFWKTKCNYYFTAQKDHRNPYVNFFLLKPINLET